MSKTGKVQLIIDVEKCKGCALCISVCPQKILKNTDKVNKKGLKYVMLESAEKCTGCALCAVICPDCAIEIK